MYSLRNWLVNEPVARNPKRAQFRAVISFCSYSRNPNDRSR